MTIILLRYTQFIISALLVVGCLEYYFPLAQTAFKAGTINGEITVGS